MLRTDTSPTTLGGEQEETEPAAHMNSKGHTHQPRPTSHSSAFPRLQPCHHIRCPVCVSFVLSRGSYQVGSTYFLGSKRTCQPHAQLCLGCQQCQ